MSDNATSVPEWRLRLAGFSQERFQRANDPDPSKGTEITRENMLRYSIKLIEERLAEIRPNEAVNTRTGESRGQLEKRRKELTQDLAAIEAENARQRSPNRSLER